MKNHLWIPIIALVLLLSPPAVKANTLQSVAVVREADVVTSTTQSAARGSIRRVALPASNPKGSNPIINGIVVNQDGKPLPKATVYAVRRDGPSLTYEKLAVDKGGKFTYASGNWTPFMAVAEGYSCGVPVDRRDRQSVRIKLYPEYIARGKVVDDNGKAIAGAKVTIRGVYGQSQNGQDRYEFPQNGKWSETITAKDGAFALAHLPDPQRFDYWSINLSISADGRATINRGFDGRDLQSLDKITQPLGCAADGILYLPGKTGPAPTGTRVIVSVTSQYGLESRYAETDANGKFHLGELPPGPAGIMLMPPQFRWNNNNQPVSEPAPYVSQAAEMTLTPGKPANVEMVLTPGAIVKGVVKKKADGLPAKRARMIVEHAGILDGSNERQMVYCDNNGEFTARVVPGDVQVSVQEYENSYYQPEDAPSVSLKLAEGEEKTGIELLVTPSSYQSANKPASADFEVKAGDYELKWDSDLMCRSFVGYGFGDRQPKDVLTLLKGKPKDASKNITYRTYQFDGKDDTGLLLVGVDKSPSAKQFDTVYIDQNRNFDLSDDSPIKASSDEGRRRPTWVEVQSHQGPLDSEHTNNPVQVSVQVYDAGARGAYCQIQKKGGWTGQMNTSAGLVQCAAWDSNCNGQFSDVAAKDRGPTGMGDFFFIDDNGLGRVITQGYGPHAVQVYKTSQIGRKFYSIKVSPVGNHVSVQPYAGPMGSIIVKADDVQGMSGQADGFSVQSDGSAYSFSECMGKPVSLPVGIYQISQCKLALNSKKLKGPFNVVCDISSPVEVKPDGQAAVSVFGPISLAIDPELKNMIWPAKSTVPLSWNIKIGSNATLTGIGENRVPPKVKFIDTKGKIVQTVNAGYT